MRWTSVELYWVGIGLGNGSAIPLQPVVVQTCLMKHNITIHWTVIRAGLKSHCTTSCVIIITRSHHHAFSQSHTHLVHVATPFFHSAKPRWGGNEWAPPEVGGGNSVKRKRVVDFVHVDIFCEHSHFRYWLGDLIFTCNDRVSPMYGSVFRDPCPPSV